MSPVYQFQCDSCGDIVDVYNQHFSVPASPICSKCSCELQQVFSPSFLQWRTSLGDTIGFATKRKFFQPHRGYDQPKGTSYFFPDKQ